MSEKKIPVHPAYAKELQHDENKLAALQYASESFMFFLKFWKFKAGSEDTGSGAQWGGSVKTLGENPWPSQVQVIEAMENVPKFFNLKARKLGSTTLGIAFDAWALRFRDYNARVHLFSRRDEAAKGMLEHVRFGLERLPVWMQLPYDKKPTLDELRLRADGDDLRVIVSYPTSEETAVEETCSHGHVDEWARMSNPELVWQAIEPTMAGSCHIITTGRGPQNFSSDFWRKCLAGDTEFVPLFVHALNRPDRDAKWLEQKRRSMTEQAFRQEFPMVWEDALYGGGRFTFRGEDVTVAGLGQGPKQPVDGHKYVKSWDIGRHQDAAVGTVIDVSVNPTQVVEYIRLRGVPYPTLQKTIERIHHAYKGPTVIEKNGPGEAVAENLDIKESEIILFNTSVKSKARIIEELQVALENRHLQWSADAWPQLDAEVRGYQIPDDNIVQDSVMSLAIANSHVNAPYSAGRLGKVVPVG